MNASRKPAEPGESDDVYAMLRPLLLSIAYDMVGAVGEAEDIVQEAFLRFHRAAAEGTEIESPKAWYWIPAYANKDGKLVCFFQAADKFKARYATFGFEQAANLDEGTMWSTSWALTKVTPADEARIAALVKKAVS